MPISYYVVPGLKREFMNHYRTTVDTSLVDSVFDTVSKFTGIDRGEIISKKRDMPISYARHLVVFFLREKTHLSLKRVGEILGGRDHTTAIHSMKTLKNLKWSDPIVAHDLLSIRAML